jgi:chemotaxis protein methyltransferase CheR
LPQLGLRWEGFRGLHGQVRKRIWRRVHSLGLRDIAAYRERLECEPAEWAKLDDACRVTISRFYRDRGVFERLGSDIFPALARRSVNEGRREVRVWSAGCASGEEPWSLLLVWTFIARIEEGVCLNVRASDADELLLGRAREGRYGAGSLKELPERIVREAFERHGDELSLRDDLRRGVTFVREDLRKTSPLGLFDLVLCRNLAFTYFDEAHRRRALERLAASLRPRGFLIIGRHETLPTSSEFAASGSGGDVFVRV